eukprot:1552283-Prymnesium_polylepis.1
MRRRLNATSSLPVSLLLASSPLPSRRDIRPKYLRGLVARHERNTRAVQQAKLGIVSRHAAPIRVHDPAAHRCPGKQYLSTPFGDSRPRCPSQGAPQQDYRRGAPRR